MRQVALDLKNQEIDIRMFASTVRPKQILEHAGLNEDQIESLITNAEVHCFKRGIESQEFIKFIDDVCSSLQVCRTATKRVISGDITTTKDLETTKRRSQ